MAWVRFDDHFSEHPKVLAAGDDAELLDFRAVQLSNRARLDGLLPAAAAERLCGTWPTRRRKTAIGALVRTGLWHAPGHDCNRCPAIEDGYVIHDILDYQPSAAEDNAKQSELSATRAEAGRKGARKRWGGDSKQPDLPIANDGKPIANGMANGWQTDSPVPGSEPVPQKQTQELEIHTNRAHENLPSDPIWAALSSELGEPQTRSEQAERTKAAAELRAAGATAEQIQHRAAEYRNRWSVPLTAKSLARKWGELAHPQPARRNTKPGRSDNARNAADEYRAMHSQETR